MIKIKLSELKPILEGLQALLEKELPIRASYWISKATKNVIKEYELFEENRQKLLLKHGEKDETGQLISENGMAVLKNPEEFNKEYHSLSNTEIQLDIRQIKLDELGDITLTPKILLSLEKIIQE